MKTRPTGCDNHPTALAPPDPAGLQWSVMPAVDDRLPASWRDLADQLNWDQIDVLAERERAGANPGILLCEARRLATRNLEDWL
jgi:hypothetical protein